MPKSPLVTALVIPVLALAVSPVLGQTAASRGTTERLFLAFIEDAAVADRQWWEGQIEFADGDDSDALLLRGVVALQPWQDVELGGRIAFGDTDLPEGVPDGRGATDADLWGKYVIGSDDRGARYAVGGVLTIPSGDESEGLGFDSFSAGLFGAARVPLDPVTLGGHIGVRFNEDGEIFGVDLDGETSASLGGMVVFPITTDLNLIGEVNYESERFDGIDSDTRVLGGVNWHVFDRGTVRAAVGFGLTDGAPDSQFIVGYAGEF